MKKDIHHAPFAEVLEGKIDKIGKNDKTVEFHGRKSMITKINKESLPSYIEDILTASVCEACLPMGFLDREESLVYYDISDTYGLEEARIFWEEEGGNLTSHMIDSFMGLVEAIYLIENYLFINDGFSLSWSRIFFCHKNSHKKCRIKLAFYPERGETGELCEASEAFCLSMNLAVKIRNLIEESLDIICDEEWAYYGAQLLKMIAPEDTLAEVKRKLILLGREISSRDWPDLSSLRQF